MCIGFFYGRIVGGCLVSISQCDNGVPRNRNIVGGMCKACLRYEFCDVKYTVDKVKNQLTC